jgi:hypothetical protein
LRAHAAPRKKKWYKIARAIARATLRFSAAPFGSVVVGCVDGNRCQQGAGQRTDHVLGASSVEDHRHAADGEREAVVAEAHTDSSGFESLAGAEHLVGAPTPSTVIIPAADLPAVRAGL